MSAACTSTTPSTASIDARERPGRPIPAGEIAASSVFGIGFGLLGGGLVLMALRARPALAWGLALCAAIVLYDLYHKGNPFSPLVMSLCRLLVYAGAAAAAVGSVPAAVWIAAIAMAAHVVGLTYAAKQESLNRVERLWPLAILALPLASPRWQVLATLVGRGVLARARRRRLARGRDAAPAREPGRGAVGGRRR